MNPQKILTEALRLHEGRWYAEAEALYRQVLAEDPGQADALHLLGVLNYEQGRMGAAVELIERALAARPDFLEARINLGAALQAGGQAERAIAMYLQALGINSNIAGVHHNLGNALLSVGRAAKAIEAYRRAISLDPKIAEAHHKLGGALRREGRLDEAIEAYRRAAALKPNDGEVFNDLGSALLERKAYDQALEVCRRAAALSPEQAVVHNNLGIALGCTGKPEEALASYERGIAIRPDYADLYNNMGVALSALERSEEAMAAFSKAIELYPNYAKAHDNMAIALGERGELEEALKFHHRAIELDPGNADARSNLGSTLTTIRKLEKSVREYSRDAAIVPDLTDARWTLGNVAGEGRGNNLVIGTAWNLKVPDVFVFVESLRRHYQGDVMMLVTSQGSESLVKYLRQNGVTPVYFDCPIWMGMHIQASRYVRFAELLRGFGREYERVFLADVTDVVFQSDPFAGLPEGELLCFLEAAGRTIAHCRTNSNWVRLFYGKDVLEQIKHNDISCSGTTIGTHAAMIRYIDLLLEHATPARFAKVPKHQFGHDQGIHNYLLRTGGLPKARIVPNGEHIFTVGFVSEVRLMYGADGTILTQGGKKCPIVHQYTYRPTLLNHVRSAFKVPVG